jgi:hypothetical protein
VHGGNPTAKPIYNLQLGKGVMGVGFGDGVAGTSLHTAEVMLRLQKSNEQMIHNLLVSFTFVHTI